MAHGTSARTEKGKRILAQGGLTPRYEAWIEKLKFIGPNAWVFPQDGDLTQPRRESGVLQALEEALRSVKPEGRRRRSRSRSSRLQASFSTPRETSPGGRKSAAAASRAARSPATRATRPGGLPASFAGGRAAGVSAGGEGIGGLRWPSRTEANAKSGGHGVRSIRAMSYRGVRTARVRGTWLGRSASAPLWRCACSQGRPHGGAEWRPQTHGGLWNERRHPQPTEAHQPGC